MSVPVDSRSLSLLIKRLLDIIVAAAAIVVLMPVLILISAAILISMGAPVLFRQARPGLHGKPFVILKFRTMRVGQDSVEPLESDAVRLTRLGLFLRSTSLDELPELVNVLIGNMSLVGPRPLLMQYLDRYTPEQMRRHEVRPGITGWAQVNGRNSLTWKDKLVLDVWYVDHRTFVLDLRILAMTFWKVIRREGINAAGEATMTEFTGE